jgi:hypothetical protein
MAAMPAEHMARSAMPTRTAMASPMPSHVIVGALLHLAMSAFAGAAFAVVLAELIWAGVRALATPAGYVTATSASGALLYVIMLYGFAPLWTTEIMNFTPRVPFFLSHLLFGATVGLWCTGWSGTLARACACGRAGPGWAAPDSRPSQVLRSARGRSCGRLWERNWELSSP